MKRKDYAQKANAIVKAANQLFLEHGYDGTTVDDILNAAKISKGTFYHYFESKEQVLDIIIEQFTTSVVHELQQIVENEDLNAVEKLNQYFQRNQARKRSQKPFMLLLMKFLYRDANVLYRDKAIRRTMEVLTPLLARILEQGNREGLLDVIDPEETAALLFTLGVSLRDRIVQELQGAEPNVEKIEKKVQTFERNTEKMLGAAPNSLTMLQPGFFRHFRTSDANMEEKA